MYSPMNACRRCCSSFTLPLNAKSMSAAYFPVKAGGRLSTKYAAHSLKSSVRKLAIVSVFFPSVELLLPDSDGIALARQQPPCNLATQCDCIYRIVTRKDACAGKISSQLLALGAGTQRSSRREFHPRYGITQVHGTGIGGIQAATGRHFAPAKQA